jgi:hypothetical protein
MPAGSSRDFTDAACAKAEEVRRHAQLARREAEEVRRAAHRVREESRRLIAGLQRSEHPGSYSSRG